MPYAYHMPVRLADPPVGQPNCVETHGRSNKQASSKATGEPSPHPLNNYLLLQESSIPVLS